MKTSAYITENDPWKWLIVFWASFGSEFLPAGSFFCCGTHQRTTAETKAKIWIFKLNANTLLINNTSQKSSAKKCERCNTNSVHLEICLTLSLVSEKEKHILRLKLDLERKVLYFSQLRPIFRVPKYICPFLKTLLLIMFHFLSARVHTMLN